jgi:hypothetical protein
MILAGTGSGTEKRRTIFCGGKEHHRENPDPLDESRRGAFPVGRLLGGFFVKHEQARIINNK